MMGPGVVESPPDARVSGCGSGTSAEFTRPTPPTPRMSIERHRGARAATGPAPTPFMYLPADPPADMPRGNSPDDGTAAHVEDDVIGAVVDHYDDPDHPDALSVADARGLLESLQALLADRWSAYVDGVREREVEVVRDTGAAIVLQDTERREWNRLLDDLQLYDQVDRTILRMCHHQAASRIVDRGFEGVDPIVAGKPDSALAGQELVEAIVDSLLREGVRPGPAWAYYGVDVRGFTAREWMERSGFEDRLSVADAVETARDELGE